MGAIYWSRRAPYCSRMKLLKSRLRRLILFALLTVVVPIFSAASSPDDPFFDVPGETGLISPWLNFVEAADIGSFQDVYSRSYLELVNERESVAPWPLTRHGYRSVLPVFEASALRIRKYVRQDLDKVLDLFKARTTGLYDFFQPSGKPLSFAHSDGSVSARQTLGEDQTSVADFDYFVYGTYHFDRGQIVAALHMVNLHNGIERSFQRTAAPLNVGRFLAEAVFDYFHRTRFPSELEIYPSAITLLSFGFRLTDGRSAYNLAKADCRAQGGRLPSKDEMATLLALGLYRGGVNALSYSTNRGFKWAVQANQVYTLNGASSVDGATSSTYLDYICLR